MLATIGVVRLWGLTRSFLCLFVLLFLANCSNAHVEVANGPMFTARPANARFDFYFKSGLPSEVVNAVDGPKWFEDLPSGCRDDLKAQAQTETADPNRHCVLLGGVSINGAAATSWGGLLRQAEDRARELGGDAVVVFDVKRPFIGRPMTLAPEVAIYGKFVDAAAIRFEHAK